MKYVKRPIVIEAIQLTEKLFWEVYDSKEPIFGKFTFSGSWHPENRVILNAYISIPTLEGTMRADINDWIIKEPFATSDRKYYPCKPDIFEKTYSPVDESPSESDAVEQRKSIVVWDNGTYKEVTGSTWEYEHDENWLVTIPVKANSLPESDAVEQDEMWDEVIEQVASNVWNLEGLAEDFQLNFTIQRKQQ